MLSREIALDFIARTNKQLNQSTLMLQGLQSYVERSSFKWTNETKAGYEAEIVTLVFAIETMKLNLALMENQMNSYNQKQKAAEFLKEKWDQLKDDCSEARQAYLDGAIRALEAVEVLSEMEAELWMLRVQKCPGHDREGEGRRWCDYCGLMKVNREGDNQ